VDVDDDACDERRKKNKIKITINSFLSFQEKNEMSIISAMLHQ
jgi:hypothetical protein